MSIAKVFKEGVPFIMASIVSIPCRNVFLRHSQPEKHSFKILPPACLSEGCRFTVSVLHIISEVSQLPVHRKEGFSCQS